MQKIRVLLNSSHSGANAWFALAEERGYFVEEGVDVAFTAGKGAWSAAKILMTEDYDFAFGDISPIVALNAEHPGVAPVAVFSIYNNSPSVIGFHGDRPIRQPSDLDGKVLIGHASDVALQTFGAYAKAAGIDAGKVTIKISDAPMLAMLLEMLAGDADGVFGYYTSQTAVLRQHDAELPGQMRFLRYPDIAPDLYGSVLLATRAVLRDKPDAVKATLRAVNRGLIATIKDPRTAVSAVIKRNPALDFGVELIRLSNMITDEICHPEIQRVGLGGIDPSRLSRAIDVLTETGNLPRLPALDEIFNADFLPDLNDRLYWPAAA